MAGAISTVKFKPPTLIESWYRLHSRYFGPFGNLWATPGNTGFAFTRHLPGSPVSPWPPSTPPWAWAPVLLFFAPWASLCFSSQSSLHVRKEHSAPITLGCHCNLLFTNLVLCFPFYPSIPSSWRLQVWAERQRAERGGRARAELSWAEHFPNSAWSWWWRG